MNIIKDEPFRTALLKRIADREAKERTGIHQSDLVFCLNRSALKRLYPEPPKDADILRWGKGYAIQRWLTGKLEDAPTVTLDGIQVTPDAFMCPCCGEIFSV